jgi:branched-chain amino acid transport system ATP-binding protein
MTLTESRPPTTGGASERIGAASSGNALELRGVTKLFGALAAISDVTMTVRAGERRAVLGSNGAGKTTLFNCVTGDFLPTSGTIRLFGEDVSRFPAHERIRRGLRRTYQILAPVRRPHGRRQRLPRLPRREPRAVLAASPAPRRRPLVARDRGADRGGPSDGGAKPPGQRAQLRPAAPARDRTRARRRAAPHPVRRAGGRPLADRAARARRHPHQLPSHMGFVIIEHDMDVALRVASA